MVGHFDAAYSNGYAEGSSSEGDINYAKELRNDKFKINKGGDEWGPYYWNIGINEDESTNFLAGARGRRAEMLLV